ncbi:hypothetical protein DH2020_006838 [Rehmannia glutinosa]|uniref:Uncharacterized protein n=1 Tax=Rehmannia glutinosa TaxID=99300 RepID=A0ABR0XK16_REHGL
MPLVDDEDSLSDVNKPYEPEMEEEKLESLGVDSTDKCESISELGDSSRTVVGERDETVSLEGKPVEAKGGEESILENHVPEREAEFIMDDVAEMIELPVAVAEEVAADEGGGGMIASQSENPPLEADEEANRLDDAKGEVVVTDTGDVPTFPESHVDTGVDELLVDEKLKPKAAEEFAPAVDVKLEMVVTDSELQTDARGDEMLVDPQLEMKAEEEFTQVVDPKVEVVVTDVGDTQQLSELQMDARGDDLQFSMEGMEALDGKSEVQMDDGKNNEAVGGLDNQSVESWVVENNTEVVVEGVNVDEEKFDVVVNDSEVGTTEKPAGIEEEKVDALITEETPITGVETDVKIITEVNACVVDRSEQEQVHESSGGTEDGGDMRCGHAEDEGMSTEVLRDSMVDEPVNMAENMDAAVKEDLPAGNIKTETETGVELELTRNVVTEEAHLADAEVETEKGTEVVSDETPEEDGKMETEETTSDMDEPGQDTYDSPALQEDDDEAMVAEEEMGTQDTGMETETDIAESGKTSGGKRKRGKFTKSPSNSKATTKASSRRKTVGEDVCFICFDGGELVLCDRRGCPKAYHPSCVNRDEAFFKSKGRWNCGVPAPNPLTMQPHSHSIYDSMVSGKHDDEERPWERGGLAIILMSGLQFDTVLGWSCSNWSYEVPSSLLRDRHDGGCFSFPLALNFQFACIECVDSGYTGWHLCSICEKNARYMCYTCTFSLCRSCIKDAVILCVRGNKGFCEACMRTVKLIENNEQGNKELEHLASLECLSYAPDPGGFSNFAFADTYHTQIDFDDKSSWEFLFKDYYIELKAKLSLSSVEIAEAKNPWKGADMLSGPSKQESSEAHADANDGGSGSDDSIENTVTVRPKRRKIRKQSKARSGEEELASTGVAAGDKAISVSENSEWASKELLEFVSHMKNGDTSLLSQFDVQALLLEYIKRNKLRDPRRKSQIICDARLESLFGKPRVGHFEMLKLLESHFLVREEQNDDFQGSVVDTENNQLDIDDVNRGVKDKKRKSRKKSYRGPQSNLDDYAAIDMHNIGLIYMRRKLMEDLLEDTEMFNDKVIGTFVRIRISGSNQKQDLYRLVQVVGTSKAAEPYKIGKKTTDIMVEILNLDKTEIVSIDTISNQEFTEEECKRLRQSIKCGLLSRLTVGEILDKTMEIQAARVNDLLKTPEERRRRLEEIPEIHADPKMDPKYESEDNDSENEDSRRDAFMRSRGSGFSRRGRGGPISPGSDISPKDSWTSAGKATSKNWESSRYLSGSTFSTKPSPIGEIVNENSWNLERGKETEESNNLEKPNSGINSESGERAQRPVSRSESFSGVTSVTPQASFSAAVVDTAVKINESEKIWHYKDPSGKVQGPFSMVQLRKWNNTGYFPADLKIWRATEKEDNSVLLADALEGKFPKELPAVDNIFPATNNTLHSSHSLAGHSGKTSGTTLLHQEKERSNMDQNSGSLSKLSAEKWLGSDTTNLPSPTPKQSNAGWNVEERGVLTGAITQTPGVNGVLSSPTPVLPNIGTHSSAAAASVLNPVVQTAPFSPTPNSQQGTLVGSTVSLHAQLNTTNEPYSVSPHTVQMPAHPPAAVQPVISQNLQSGQPQGYGWGTPNNVQNSSGSFSNSAGLQPDVWRPPTQPSQPNMHPPTTPNASWGMGPPPVENNTPVGVRPENPNIGWGMMPANPNMPWGNIPPGNTNMNWVPAMPVPPPPGNNTPGWVAPPVNSGWGPPVQGPPVVGNGWGPPSGNAVQGPPPPAPPPPQGNTNQGFAPSGNQGGSWGGEQNHMGGQFSGQRGPPQGRDSGFSGGGGRPWNRQGGFGGGGRLVVEVLEVSGRRFVRSMRMAGVAAL